MIPKGQICRGGSLGCNAQATKQAVDRNGNPGTNDFYYTCDNHIQYCERCGRSEMDVLVDIYHPNLGGGARTWRCQDGRCEEFIDVIEGPQNPPTEKDDVIPCPHCPIGHRVLMLTTDVCSNASCGGEVPQVRGYSIEEIAQYQHPMPFHVEPADGVPISGYSKPIKIESYKSGLPKPGDTVLPGTFFGRGDKPITWPGWRLVK